VPGGAEMKIIQANAYLCDLEPMAVRVDATQKFTKQETIFVDRETTDGVVGTGYSYTIGTGGRAVLELLRTDLLELVVGEDAMRVEALWKRLFLATHATTVGAITSLALAAVDIAAWDVRCRALGQSLWQLAGGARDSLPLYDTEGGWLNLTTEELVAAGRDSVARGFRGIKVKIGKADAREDLERLLALREAVGPRISLMVDANQAFTSAEARRRAQLLSEVDLEWLEEPLPADDVAGHRMLAASIAIPIAVGESIYSLGGFREYLAAGAAGVIQPDAARIGGITPWLRAAHLADAFNVKVAPHFLMELHVSLAAAVPNSLYIEHIPQLTRIARSEMQVVDGLATPPSSPGIGIEWDREAIETLAHR
jgi:L-alanine-DL-glutamate epimerase-like enolase superfamily enzyme